jgi:hypothetical protein
MLLCQVLVVEGLATPRSTLRHYQRLILSQSVAIVVCLHALLSRCPVTLALTSTDVALTTLIRSIGEVYFVLVYLTVQISFCESQVCTGVVPYTVPE